MTSSLAVLHRPFPFQRPALKALRFRVLDAAGNPLGYGLRQTPFHPLLPAKDLEELKTRALDAIYNGVTIVDLEQPDAPIIYANEAFERLTGYTVQEVLGKNCRFLQGDQRDQAGLGLIRQALRERRPLQVTLKNFRKDGTLFYNELTLFPVEQHGQVRHYVGIQKDITHQVETDLQLQEQALRLESAQRFAQVTHFEYDPVNNTFSSGPQGALLLGLPEQPIVDLHLDEFMGFLPQRIHEGFQAEVQKCTQNRSPLDTEIPVVWPDGTEHWLHLKASWEATPLGHRLIGLSMDITSQKEAHERIKFLAHYDVLTHLPNRALLQDRLDQALHHARDRQSRVAVMFMDLDRFKHINDTLGHEVGDRLLKSVAARLKSILRKGDTVARLGGDEFVFVLSGFKGLRDVGRLCERILGAVQQPFRIQSHELHVTASIGISVYPDEALDASMLLQQADAAMYQAKAQQGGNNHQFYSPELRGHLQERLVLENGLRNAIRREEMHLVYQPKVDLTTLQVCGAEVLCRWIHPELGPIGPDRFIPLAEEIGEMHHIGNWVLETAFQQHLLWRKQGLDLPTLAINVSPQQINSPLFVTHVQQCLQKYHLRPEQIILEITETLLIKQEDVVLQQLQALSALGIVLSLDDFGTGFSSLSHLNRFPVREVKIDREFMQPTTSSQSRALVESILLVAHKLGKKVVAEGVEDTETLQFLQAEGCTEAQGYHISRPLTAEQFLLWATEDRGLWRSGLKAPQEV